MENEESILPKWDSSVGAQEQRLGLCMLKSMVAAHIKQNKKYIDFWIIVFLNILDIKMV